LGQAQQSGGVKLFKDIPTSPILIFRSAERTKKKLHRFVLSKKKKIKQLDRNGNMYSTTAEAVNECS
jgi:hypothetical protein